MNLLAIDAGTGSVRAVVFNAAGQSLGSASRAWEHRAIEGIPGSMDFDVEHNWALVCECIKGAIADAGVEASSIAAAAATSMREGIVVLDEHGQEIWAVANVDARAEHQVVELGVDAQLEERVYAGSGQTFALAAQPRLKWLEAHQPETYAQARTLVMLSDWVAYRLSSVAAVEPSNGSTSGMLALDTRAADATLASSCGVRDDLLPPVVEPGTVLGPVTSAAAADTGLTTSTVVVAGGGDAQLAVLGTGVNEPGAAMVIGGTFWQLEVNVSQPHVPADMSVRVNAAALPHLWQAEAIAFHTGTAIRWFRDTFAGEETRAATEAGIDPLTYLVDRAAEVPPGSDGVIPVFSDRMNYRAWRHAAPSFLNLNLEGGPRLRAAMFRSLMENAAVVTAENLDLVAQFATLADVPVAFGGGAAKSPVWTQMVSDVLGRPVRVPVETEATARGAAACAAAGAGLFADPAEAATAWSAWDRHHEPDLRTHAIYTEVREQWKAAYAPQLALMDAGVTTSMWRAPGA
ncbi:autoinducer-2 kinase [Demequina sp. B12]|uniref:autoinducer-2 kinase n=1 Tax=Demequina sp. B12 TaxID=2992757 RepID=UPI00237BE204|nr:autoinducer-2 kinase [Demequina sp. B12]MDE0573575.1 autoinducer-2 kinase [Demequina sp. B12]